MSIPNIVFGAGGIGITAKSFTFTWNTPEAVNSLLSSLQGLGIEELDSAASYPPTNPWNTETLLGQAKAGEKGFIIDSKIAAHGKGLLDDESITFSIGKTLSLLGMKKVRTIYSHKPDPNTPIEETAAAYHKQYLAGKFERVKIPNISLQNFAGDKNFLS